MTADLFGETLLPGLDYRPDFIDAAEEGELIGHLEAMDLSPFRFHGWTGKRKTHTFGWRYDFDDASFAPAEPLPGWLQPLRARAAAFAGVEPDEIGHALLARYDQVTARHFRHGTGFLRWRLDKDPRQCTFEQLAPELRPSELKEMFGQ